MEIKGKKVAVTGSCGFVGSHLMDVLKELEPKSLQGIDLHLGHDLTKITQTSNLLKGCDVVFNLATLPLPLSLTNPYLVCNEIYQMALTLCELCRQKVFKTLIHVSSSEVYGSAVYEPMDERHPYYPTTPYAGAKAAADMLIRTYRITFNIDVATVRPFNIYGPGQPVSFGGVVPTLISKMIKNEPIQLNGDGLQSRDFMYVKDAVRGMIDTYRNKQTRGEVINIATNRETRIRELADILRKITHYNKKITFGPPRLADVQRHVSDTRKARQMIGFFPRTTLEQGLRHTVRWFSTHI